MHWPDALANRSPYLTRTGNAHTHQAIRGAGVVVNWRDDLRARQDAAPNVKENFHDTLLKRIASSPDFPAFAQTVQQTYRMVEDEYASANDLVALILKDPALTHRILRLANAVEYRHLGGQVTTISRAVNLMGFEEIRMAALAMSLFEQIESEQHSRQLQSRFLQALYQAFMAQNIAGKLGGIAKEEMFLSALFQDLGALLIYRHAPEHLTEIERARRDEGLDEATAIQKVTGILPVALAREVCQKWGLPDSARRFLTSMPSASHISRLSPAAKAAALGQLANSIAQTTARAPSAAVIEQETRELAQRYGIDKHLVQEAVQESREHILEYESMLPHARNKPAFLARMEMNEDAEPAKEQTIAEVPEVRSELLLACIEETTSRLMGEYQFNDIFNDMLKAMADGLDLDLATLYMFDRKNRRLLPRLGHGPRFAATQGEMTVALNEDSQIGHAFLAGEEKILSRPSMPRDDVLDWQLRGRGDMAMMIPLHINRAPFGLFYLEGHASAFHAGNTNSLRTLRNQAVLAIKSKSNF